MIDDDAQKALLHAIHAWPKQIALLARFLRRGRSRFSFVQEPLDAQPDVQPSTGLPVIKRWHVATLIPGYYYGTDRDIVVQCGMNWGPELEPEPESRSEFLFSFFLIDACPSLLIRKESL